jgi:hypothetical protein
VDGDHSISVPTITTIFIVADALMPLLVIDRKTIDDAVWGKGWRDWKDFFGRSNNPSDLT